MLYIRIYAYTIVAATLIFTHISSPNLLHHIFAEFIAHKAHISVLPQNAKEAEGAAGGAPVMELAAEGDPEEDGPAFVF